MLSVRMRLPVVAVVGAGVLTACGSDGDPAPGTVTGTATQTVVQTTGGQLTSAAAPPTSGGTVDARRAVEAALAAKEGGAVIELDDEEDTGVWEVTLLLPDGSGVEVVVDMADGTVSGDRRTRPEADESTPPALTAAQAIDRALAEQQGRVVALDFGREDGRTVWQVSVVGDDLQEWEIDLDPANGEVIRVDRD